MNNTIVHTISAHNVFGPEKTIINESLALLKEGYKVVIILIHRRGDFPLLARIKQSNIPCFHLVSNFKFNFFAIFKLIKLLLKTKCNLVHGHGYKADIISLIACKMIGVPIITTMHGWTAEDCKIRIYEKLQAFFWRFFDLILCVSESYKQKAVSIGIPENKTVVVHNGIIINDYLLSGSEVLKKNFLNKYGIPGGHFIVGVVGRLSIEKGHRYFVEAALKVLSQEKDVVFVIIGDGKERKNIEDIIRNSKYSKNFYMLGHISSMQKVYAALDIVIISSLREGLPNALLEAMVCGKPVVSTSVGGIPEIIKNNINGVMVSPRDSDAIANALLALIRNPEDINRIVVAARRTILEQFTFKARMDKIKRIYEKMAKNSCDI
ncbi:MAG: glycosyltransferase family 4 protein [Spirochaetes bacterium]|nr:glycosyltransferase family 4 protein [Spirochaetota bacterium]